MSAYTTEAGRTTRLQSEKEKRQQILRTDPRYLNRVSGVTRQRAWFGFWFGMGVQAMGLLALAVSVALMLAGGHG